MEWASPIVCVRKACGAIRICGDFKTTLNPCIYMYVDPHPLPRFEDLMSKITGSKHFTKIDLTEAYLQMEVDEQSRKYFVIATHIGYFQYKRLPFGVNIQRLNTSPPNKHCLANFSASVLAFPGPFSFVFCANTTSTLSNPSLLIADDGNCLSNGTTGIGTGVGAVMGDIVSLVLDEPSSCLGSRGSCCARIAMLYDSGVTHCTVPPGVT